MLQQKPEEPEYAPRTAHCDRTIAYSFLYELEGVGNTHVDVSEHQYIYYHNPLPHRDTLTLLQTEQTQIRQLLQELPDQGLLCLLRDI